ncbi:hypothetical protein ACQFYA_15425 [Promicromonospora sp. Marseille-Q5078]
MTSQTVWAAGAPNAIPMGTRATEIIDELIGLSSEPSANGRVRRVS